jgi:hypothetical protein
VKRRCEIGECLVRIHKLPPMSRFLPSGRQLARRATLQD